MRRTDQGSPEKPAGTVFVALAERGREAVVQRHYFPTDRETFKHLVAQAVMDLLLRTLEGRETHGARSSPPVMADAAVPLERSVAEAPL